MRILSAPKINRLVWSSLILVWISFALINLVTRQVLKVESLEYGLYSALDLVLVNIFICLVFREAIYRFSWINTRSFSTWFFIALSSLILGVISSTLVIAVISVYLVVAGYTSSFIFFWNSVWANWSIMSIMIFLWAVIYLLSNYVLKLKSLELKEKDLELELKKAQLSNLVSQVNPHFIFNGLNNIKGLMLEDVNKSREMVTALSELLRYSLQSNQNKLQPIKNELEMVRHYIDLMKIQHEERLIYVENVDKLTLENEVPPMLIQLLVENAIKHGIEQFIDGGELNLSISSIGDKVKIIVCNPGNLHLSKIDRSSPGLGIKNIKERIALLYEGEATFNLVCDKKWVTATVVIPKLIIPTETSEKSSLKKIDMKKAAAISTSSV